jgi:bile acid-coenzyme A ligase
VGTPLGQVFTRLAQARPDAPAVTCGETTLTFLELERRANRLARSYARLGVHRDSFVTIGLPNGTRFPEAVVATWKLGAIPQPVSSRLPLPELQSIVGLADSALVVGLDPQDGRPCVPADDEADPALPDEPLAAVAGRAWKAPTSGGSTGRPKLIVSGTPGLVEQVTARSAQLGIGGSTVHLSTAPLSHNGPFVYALYALLLGGHVVVMPRFDASEALRAVARHRVTWMYAVPTMLSRICRLPAQERAAADLSSLRTVFSTAAACPPSVKQAWIDWIGPEKVVEGYAGTEAQMGTLIRGDEWLEHRGSVGRAAYGRFEVRDDDGRRCAPGAVGEIWLLADGGPGSTYRYVGAEPRRSADGWESLGDMGRVDEDGYLYLEGRSADMVVVGGANVYPAEVEAALVEHPQVAAAVVVGLPDDDLGARLHALLQVTGEVTDDALRAHLRDRLVPYKWPRTFERTAGPLRDDADKVRRASVADGRT